MSKFRLEEIRRMADSQRWEWVRPDYIVDLAFDKAKALKFAIYADRREIEEETEDEVVVDYLVDVGSTGEVEVNGKDVVQAATFLIQHAWSVAASERLSEFGDLLHESEVDDCVKMIEAAFEREEAFPRDLLRSFALGFFEYTGRDGFRFTASASRESLDSLDRILQEPPLPQE